MLKTRIEHKYQERRRPGPPALSVLIPKQPPQVDVEACRAQAIRTEAEARARVEEEASRERSSLKEARSALEAERSDLLRRVARAEAAGQAARAEVRCRVCFFSVLCSDRHPLPSSLRIIEPALRSGGVQEAFMSPASSSGSRLEVVLLGFPFVPLLSGAWIRTQRERTRCFRDEIQSRFTRPRLFRLPALVSAGGRGRGRGGRSETTT